MTVNYEVAMKRLQEVTRPGEYLPGLEYATQMACLDIELKKSETLFGKKV